MANFYKGKNSIVKRANQICTLCAANVVTICFSICGQMYVFGDETIINAFEEETTIAPQCTLKCTAHKPPRYFKLQNWTNKNNISASSSSASSFHMEKGQKKCVKSPINPPTNMDEFSDKLIVPQIEQLEEKMEEFKEIMAQQYLFLRTQLNVTESSAMQKID
ncbi:PREDICTED: MADS-box transcription factor 18-like [Ipomoea nil]|uniref:MADS-box transcription factor 18-like n=1 Tax=Ipomoea nil TaxID=35883 RepID=UPI0009019A3A|nr:PREDICTED: MADS-box transcription factor 18-like [Ipomoea nil]